MSSTEEALSNGERKAATVLAGSVIEALLLDAILKHPDPKEIEKAKDKLNGRQSQKDPEWWFLPSLITVAFELKIINEQTEKGCRIAQDFRNYIHPGKGLRLNRKCDQEQAHIAYGVIFSVLKELSVNDQ